MTFICEINPDPPMALSLLEEILFLLVSFLLHPGAIGRILLKEQSL